MLRGEESQLQLKGEIILKCKYLIVFDREVGLKQSPLKKASKLPIKKLIRYENECIKNFLKLRTIMW